MAASSIVSRLRRGMAYLALPWFRMELPGWRRLFKPFGLSMRDNALWEGVPAKVCRGKYHRYRMVLRMDDWCERLTYFLGSYDSPEVDALLAFVLKAGDTFVDVGANVGMTVLTAARAIGPEGRIFAIEPNPDAVERLKKVVDMNALKNVTVFPIGFGDQDGELPLQTIDQSSVWASFTRREELPGLTYRTVKIPVRRADGILPDDLSARTVIKIDAEGFECRVLDGMKKILARHPLIITEIESELLVKAGNSANELWMRMSEAGYLPFLADVGSRLDYGRPAVLHPAVLGKFTSASRDIVWIHPASPYRDELLHQPESTALARGMTDQVIRLARSLKADEWPLIGRLIRKLGRRWNLWIYADGIPARIDERIELKLSPRAFSGGPYRFDPKLTEELRHLAVPGKAFIDAGAHVGICSLLYAALTGPDTRVAAFEPNPNVYPLLSDNVRVSGCRIQPLAVALGDREGEVSFYVNGRDPNASLSAVAPGKYFMWRDKPKPVMTEHRVPMTTVDAFCRREGYEPALLKLDVEGAELPVLRGAEETLRRWRPTLILETHAFAWESFGYSGKDLEEFLRSHGYELFTATGVPFHGVLGTGPEVDNNHYIVRPVR